MKKILLQHQLAVWTGLGAICFPAVFLWAIHPLPYSAQTVLSILGLTADMDHASALSHLLHNPKVASISGLNEYHPHYLLYGLIVKVIALFSSAVEAGPATPTVLRLMTGINVGLWAGGLVLWSGFLIKGLRPSSTLAADRRLKIATVCIIGAAVGTLPGFVRGVLEAGVLPIAFFLGMIFLITIERTARRSQSTRITVGVVAAGIVAGLAHPLNLIWCLYIPVRFKGSAIRRLGPGVSIVAGWSAIVLVAGWASGSMEQVGLLNTIGFFLTMDAMPVQTESQVFYPAAAFLEPPLRFGPAAAVLESPGYWSGVFIICNLLFVIIAALFVRDVWSRSRMRPGFHRLSTISAILFLAGGAIFALVFFLSRSQTSLYILVVPVLALVLPSIAAVMRTWTRVLVLSLVAGAALVCLVWNTARLGQFSRDVHLETSSTDAKGGRIGGYLSESLRKRLCRPNSPLVVLAETAYLPTVLPLLSAVGTSCPGKTVEVRPFPSGFSLPWFDFRPEQNNPPPGGWEAYRRNWLSSMEAGMFYPGQAENIARYIEFVYRSAAGGFSADRNRPRPPDYIVYFRHRNARVFITRRGLEDGRFAFEKDELVLGLAWLRNLQESFDYRLQLLDADSLAPAIGRWSSKVDVTPYELISGVTYSDSVMNVFYAYQP